MTAIDLLRASYTRGLGAAPGTASRIGDSTVVCTACGCRLTSRSSGHAGDAGADRWFHFAGSIGRDARGCTVGCVDAAHTIA
ncbi:MAG: hypothetical protein M0T75_12595 [Chloroflexi bacterium]|nr:hypothetical protein [Chloroflexota bacterium]